MATRVRAMAETDTDAAAVETAPATAVRDRLGDCAVCDAGVAAKYALPESTAEKASDPSARTSSCRLPALTVAPGGAGVGVPGPHLSINADGMSASELRWSVTRRRSAAACAASL